MYRVERVENFYRQFAPIVAPLLPEAFVITQVPGELTLSYRNQRLQTTYIGNMLLEAYSIEDQAERIDETVMSIQHCIHRFDPQWLTLEDKQYRLRAGPMNGRIAIYGECGEEQRVFGEMDYVP